MFTLSVMTDPIPTFGDTTVAPQVYMQHREIESIDAAASVRWRCPADLRADPRDLPEGLTFDAETLISVWHTDQGHGRDDLHADRHRWQWR